MCDTSQKPANVIQPFPPADGNEWDCQCARCGSSADRRECFFCDDGFVVEDLGDDVVNEFLDVPCSECKGRGGDYWCISSPEWCEANPLPDRESIERGQIEWFVTTCFPSYLVPRKPQIGDVVEALADGLAVLGNRAATPAFDQRSFRSERLPVLGNKNAPPRSPHLGKIIAIADDLIHVEFFDTNTGTINVTAYPKHAISGCL